VCVLDIVELPIDLKPDTDELDITEPYIVEPFEALIVSTANYFFTLEKYKVRDELMNWCRTDTVKAGILLLLLRNQSIVLFVGSNRELHKHSFKHFVKHTLDTYNNNQNPKH
jgi:hypothetical protein